MRALPSDSEQAAIFKSIANGDATAYKILFDRYKLKVYGTAFKWTKSSFAAEEITQDVFISIWISRSNLSAVKDPQAYIYTIIYNRVKKYLKKESNQLKILDKYKQKNPACCNETEETVDANETEKIINTAIEKLSPNKKIIYKLSRQQGKSCDEIAETLKVSPNTVKSHLMKAVKSIRHYIKENALLLISLLTYWLRF